MKLLKLCVLSFLSLLLASSCKSSNPELTRTLIITGQNNHNWEVSHVAIKKTLENSKLFEVDVCISPPQGDDMSGFKIDFSPYKLVVVDYVGDHWPKETREGFLKHVESGGGVVIYHAANNAFTDWEEYNKIIALGGWNDRDEKSGPWVYWEEGELIKDNSPGNGGSHGSQHEYVLNSRNDKHPITKGLPRQWKHTKDELYDRMRGPGNIKDILYTAYSAPETNGSGREEPLIFTVEYGKGRIFHTMLGHAGENIDNNPSMQCAGFQTILLRGSEWAATGSVTQSIPKDFPKASEIRYRTNYSE